MAAVYRYFLKPSFWIGSAWAITAWFLAQIFTLFFIPASLPIPPAHSIESEGAPTASGRLLGDIPLSRSQFSINDIRLIGLLAAGQRGTILISVRNGPTLTLTASVRHSEGWMLEGVDNDVVRLSHFGSMFDLPVPRSSRGLTSPSPSN